MDIFDSIKLCASFIIGTRQMVCLDMLIKFSAAKIESF